MRQDVFALAHFQAQATVTECGTKRESLIDRLTSMLEISGSETKPNSFKRNALYAVIEVLAELSNDEKYEMRLDDHVTAEQYAESFKKR